MGKSKYKGVHQRKNGSWYYRIKKTFEDGSVEYYQKSGFQTEDEAHKSRIAHLREIMFGKGHFLPPINEDDIEQAAEFGIKVEPIYLHDVYVEYEPKTFHEVFVEFLHSEYVGSEATAKKYQALYNAQLAVWADREIHSFNDTDIDLLLLKISLQGYKASYQASIRKLIKKIFYYANLVDPTVAGDLGVGLSTKPYKLRVLSLFSGIGAPEQALKNLGVDYEIVNFCEIDDKAAEAYCLLHGGETIEERELFSKKRIKDVNELHRGLNDHNWEYERSIFESMGLEGPKHNYAGNIPDFDIMFFGFPCQNISPLGNKKGLKNEDGELTDSGLFFKAMEIAYIKKPKIMIAENVDKLVSNEFRQDFARILQEFEDCGYTYYNRIVDAAKFGLPQSRKRIFMVLIRNDLNIIYKFPQGFPLEVRAEEWFEPVVDDEYYLSAENVEKALYRVENKSNYRPNFNTDVISCLTTNCGQNSPSNRQTLVKDDKGIRCLSSEELMRFQGFTKEQGKMLRDNGFSKNEVGHMVGNSIAVPAIQAVLENLFKQLCKFEKPPVKYDFVTNTTERRKNTYIDPLFVYSGNKSKLLTYLLDYMPKDLHNMNFVDLFAGTATVAINVNAKRVLINDVNKLLVDIYKGLSCTPPEKGWKMICTIIDKYHLGQDTPEYYTQCRIEYNIKQAYTMPDYWYWGLALIYHSFNSNTVEHNQAGDLNSPYGYDRINMGVSQKRFFPFAKKMYENNYEISNKDFRKAIPLDMIPEETFIYLDPPYWITEASYNKIWFEEQERALYDYLDEWHKKGFKWMLSNVTQNKNRKNDILLDWIEKHKEEYNVYYPNRKYNNCNYHRENIGETVEVLITNYKE